MSTKPKNGFPGCWAGGNINGTTLAVQGGQGIKSVTRTAAGDGAGDYTVTLEDAYKIQVGLGLAIGETHNTTHPFNASITQPTSSTFRVRWQSNGAAADENFSFAIFAAGPTTSIP